MKLIVSILIIFTLFSKIFAQNLPDYLDPGEHNFDKAGYKLFIEKKRNPKLLKEYIALEKRNYDVLRYDLYMDWYDLISKHFETGNLLTFEASNKIQLVILENNVSFIELDAMLLNIESITINGQPSNNSNKKALGILKVNFNQTFNSGDTVVLDIKYNFSSSENEGGINVYEKGTPIELGPPPNYDTVFIEEKIAYTMAEPIDARYWMPCNDRPYDKALSSFTVKVPKGYTVTSNGLLTKKVDLADSSTFFWKHDYPVTTYLMHAAASKYHYYYDWYRRVSNPDDSIKIEYYVWEKDFQDTSSDGMTHNATYAFRNSVKMMEFYSTIFGEYPYERYGMDAVLDCWFGGMEHQTITTLHRNVLRKKNRWGGNADNGNQLVIAHEMAHQWLGDLITCASWNDIWINEGGAVWSETLWQGRTNPDNYNWAIMGKMQTYLYYNTQNVQPPVYAPPIDNVFNYATTYMKAGSIYHMLGVMLGKERFLEILREMFAEYGYKSLDTEEFKNFLKSKVENPPVDFDTFFEQWIYKAGHPIYMVTHSTRKNQADEFYKVNLNLAQLQEGDDIPNVFQTCMWVKFFGPDGIVYIDSLVNKDRIEQFTFTLPFKPDSLQLDTVKTLCQVYAYVTDVEDNSDNATVIANIYPNPSINKDKSFLSLELKEDSFIDIEINDNLGRKMDKIKSGFLTSGYHLFDIQTKNLASGIYLISIQSKGKLITKQLNVLK
jgi:aminopeptidase N